LRLEIGQEPLHCWAVTSRYQKHWQAMKIGDWVLLKTNGTDTITWSGQFLARVQSASLGKFLWPYEGEKPWEFIYFLSNVKAIRKSRIALVTELGYKEKEVIQHFLPVLPDRVESVVKRYGSLDAFVAHLPDAKNEIKNVAPARVSLAASPKAEILIPLPAHLKELCLEIEVLRRSSNHKERGHESLVEGFYRAMGWRPHEDIQFQTGRIDVLVSREGRPYFVNEVKRDWGLGRFHDSARKQAYDYAMQVGARFVVVTNGDYYARYDRKKGDTYDENFEFDFKLTELRQCDLEKLDRFRR
jgi:hypothetical protein